MKSSSTVRQGLLALFLGFWTAFTAPAATYTLTLNANGSGSVGRNPSLSIYPGGAVVTLTAIPATGWMFTGWEGDIAGSSNPVNLSMDADKVVTVNFVQIPIYALAVTVAGQGTVEPPGGTFPSNSVVSLAASPAAGWLFSRWTGSASGEANPLSLTVNSDLDVQAVFVQSPTIVTQPQSVLVPLGSLVSFQVAAEGTPPFSYVWQLNGTVLPGYTEATFSIPSVQANDAGDYRVVVSNPYGTVTSEPATLEVQGECSGPNVVRQCEEAALREAIGRGGTVEICCNGTITLGATIDIASSVTLEAGAHTVTISGNQAVRLFNVAANVTFEMRNLTLANGWHVGANGANSVSGQPGEPGEDAVGGALYNDGGTVRLVSCTLSNNAALGGKGGNAGFPDALFSAGSGGAARGGALFNDGGVVWVESSLMVSNTSVAGAGGVIDLGLQALGGEGSGGALASFGGAVHITNSVLMGNRVSIPLAWPSPPAARGGALFMEEGLLTLTKSTLVGNQAFGGRFTSTLEAHAGSAYGGAVTLKSGTAVFDRSAFLTNTAESGFAFRQWNVGDGQGGAVHSLGNIEVRDSTFTANRAVGGVSRSRQGFGLGGAIYNGGRMSLTGTTLDRNLARGGRLFGSSDEFADADAAGGAIYNTNSLSATNCTLALNLSEAGWSYRGSGTAYGGAAFNGGGTMELMNVTIASNGVVQAYGGYPQQGSPPAQGASLAITNGALTLRNSLVAYGLGFSNSYAEPAGAIVTFTGISRNASGTLIDGGFNMSSDASCDFQSGTSFNFTDPRLGALIDNGGPTLTMALQPESPASDFGTTVGAAVVDQRGFPRPSGDGADMGAYEDGPPALRLVVSRNGLMLELSFTAQPEASYELQSSSDLAAWPTIETIGPVAGGGTVSRTFPLTDPQRFFRLKTSP